MNERFLLQLYAKQQLREPVPNNETISTWASKVIGLLYPELSICLHADIGELDNEFMKLQVELTYLLNSTKACWDCNNEYVSAQFFDGLPEMYRILNTDVEAILEGDPAARNRFEVVRAYPGFYALCFYRIAHALHKLDVPLVPRILTEYAHSQTGIDIHPGAEIDEYFHIDHGTGIVIGETTSIGKHVKLYQGVTLGALSVDKRLAYTKRHPTVEDHVVIYSGATILGGDTVIGHHSVIGGNVWLTRSIQPGTMVYHNAEIKVTEGKILI